MTFKTLLMSTALVSLLSAPAMAQDTTLTQDPTTDPAPQMQSEADVTDGQMAAEANEPMSIEEMTVDQFIGLDVQSADGEDVGEIDYVIGGLDGGEAQAVIGIGGFLGLGEYTVALPISAFDFNSVERILVVNASEQELRDTPEFDESGAESVDGSILMAELMGAPEDAGTETGMTDDSGMSGESTADDATMADEPATDDAPAMEEETMEKDSTAPAEEPIQEEGATTEPETETETETNN
ncbi:PRC-barrel domain-containing protein [Primorskyibacter sp. 2E107]|uniref:PRC-barrel domain-containing protein n=1 Tax=Primorskyibacter sp. 2E107 TaxID=3403458 RepID=UPI003AF492C0